MFPVQLLPFAVSQSAPHTNSCSSWTLFYFFLSNDGNKQKSCKLYRPLVYRRFLWNHHSVLPPIQDNRSTFVSSHCLPKFDFCFFSCSVWQVNIQHRASRFLRNDLFSPRKTFCYVKARLEHTVKGSSVSASTNRHRWVRGIEAMFFRFFMSDDLRNDGWINLISKVQIDWWGSLSFSNSFDVVD